MIQGLQQVSNKINYNRANQCYKLADTLETKLYSYLGGCKTEWIRLAGFPVGIVSISLSFLAGVATIVEAIFKGLVNLFTAFSNNGDGANQFLGGLISQVIGGPSVILSRFYYQFFIGYRITLLMNTLGFLFNPQKFIQESIHRSKEPLLPSFSISWSIKPDLRPFNTYFDLANTDQCQEIMYRYVKAPIYGWLKNKSVREIRWRAPFVGIASCFITTVFNIMGIAETILKGSLNILGFPFFDQCKIRKGVNQITFETFKKLVLSPVVIIYENCGRMGHILENFTFVKVDYWGGPKKSAEDAEKHLNGTKLKEATQYADHQNKIQQDQETIMLAAPNPPPLPNKPIVHVPQISDTYKWL